MPSSRNKPSNKQNFLKRRSFEQGRAELDAAFLATQRLYCDVLEFWRGCALRSCKRHRRCCGAPGQCLLRGLVRVPPSRRLKARNDVIAGGPRRIAPATHVEWSTRRADFKSVASWSFG
jgi:hypothetical protein